MKHLKKQRNWICTIAFFVLLLTLSTTVFAAKIGNKYSTGAVFPDYQETVTIQVDPVKFDRTFKEALLEAEEKASSLIQYKIVLPPGTYTAERVYRLPSNTHIYARGVTIYAKGTRVGMLVTDATKKSENIIVEGGTWSTVKQNPVSGTMLRFLGVKNMMLKDMKIQSNRKNHIIEVADMNGFTVTGCAISGNNKDNKAPYKSVQSKEALQLDVAIPSAMPGFDTAPAMYNGKGCHRVLIKNNTFYNCARGVGSHSGTGKGIEKYPYTYITVTGNTIKNLLGEAVYSQNWRYSAISANKISNCRQAGIYLLDTYSIRLNKNHITNVKQYTGARKTTYDPNGEYGVGVLARRSNLLYMDYNTIQKTARKGILLEAGYKKVTNKKNQVF